MRTKHLPWNKGKLVGQKAPLRLSEIWSIRIRLEIERKTRDLAFFNLAIDSKLRGCDLVSLRVRDISTGGVIARRAVVLQRKTGRPVQFEISDLTRAALADWIRVRALATRPICSLADVTLQRISPPGSTPVSWRHGC